MQEANEKWEKSQSIADFDAVEEVELEYEKACEYQTAAQHGVEEQVKYLKALDYGDNICEGWRRFFVCKAGGAGNYCGYAFPAKLWLQKGRVAALDPACRFKPGNWKYKCCCMWEYLQEEAVDRPDSAAAEWFRDMSTHFGEIQNFPHIGCGANYVPFKRALNGV